MASPAASPWCSMLGSRVRNPPAWRYTCNWRGAIRARDSHETCSDCCPAACPFIARPFLAMTKSVEAILDAAQQRAREAGLPYFGAVTPGEAHALLSDRATSKLIDVRTRAEWDYVGRVPGSILIEWNTYPDGMRNPGFLDELRQCCPDSSAPVLFFCRSGQRSDGAARVAKAAGYSMAFNVLEGFEGDRDSEGHRGTLGGWRKAGLPWIQG